MGRKDAADDGQAAIATLHAELDGPGRDESGC